MGGFCVPVSVHVSGMWPAEQPWAHPSPCLTPHSVVSRERCLQGVRPQTRAQLAHLRAVRMSPVIGFTVMEHVECSRLGTRDKPRFQRETK